MEYRVIADGQVIKNIADLKDIPEGDFFYLASPFTHYRDGPQAAAQAICRVASRLWLHDVPFFCPIAHCYALGLYGNVDMMAHEKWMRHDRPFMLAAYAMILVRLPGWDESVGIGQEEDYFSSAGKLRIYLDPLPAEMAVTKVAA
jgi:hypothetical protein